MPLDLKQQRVLITGGGGFLGRHVCAKLADMGVEMWAPSSDEMNCVWLDGEDSYGIGDRSLDTYFDRLRPTVVIHLAANCGGIGKNQAAPADMFHDNMLMGFNILEMCRIYSARLVLVGTVCSYPKHCHVPFKESDLWNGYPEETNAPYGIAKRALFEMARAYHQQYGLKVACLLPANLYGPGDNFDLETSHVIPAMIRKFVDENETKSGSVDLWGSGEATREFLYVEDAAEAVIRAAEIIDSSEPINIGTGQERSIHVLAKLIHAIVNKPDIDVRSGVWTHEAERVMFPHFTRMNWDISKPDGQPRRCLDTSRAKELMGWEAKTDLETGLRKTINWYLEHRKEPVSV